MNQVLLNNTAQTFTGITVDIDSTVRNITNPDIGAKEYTPCSPDAGINEITGIQNPLTAGTYQIKVILQNQSTSTLTSVNIHWRVNGVSQTTFNWSGSLSGSSWYSGCPPGIRRYPLRHGNCIRNRRGTAWQTNPGQHLNSILPRWRLYSLNSCSCG